MKLIFILAALILFGCGDPNDYSGYEIHTFEEEFGLPRSPDYDLPIVKSPGPFTDVIHPDKFFEREEFAETQ